MAGLVAALPHGLPSPEKEIWPAEGALLTLPLALAAADAIPVRPVTGTPIALPLSAAVASAGSNRTGTGSPAVLSLLAGLADGSKALTVTGTVLGLPIVAAFPGSLRPTRRLGYVFATPTVDDIEYAGPPRPAIRTRIPVGLTVWRDLAGWHTKYSPTPRDLATADRVYGGGRIHPVSVDEIAELTAAGFGDRILLEPLP